MLKQGADEACHSGFSLGSRDADHPHFAGGMIRFDFVTLQPEEDGKAPTPQSNARVIMPPQGFLMTFNSMQQLIDKLIEAGVLQKNENAR